MSEPGPERVRVKDWRPRGFHVRAPWYLRGKTGVIERRLGAYRNPEDLAYHREAEKIELVRVRFTMRELWGEAAETPEDTLDAEIFVHWLEPVEENADAA